VPEDRELAADERAEIQGYLLRAGRLTGLDPQTAPSPAVVVRAINETVRHLREGRPGTSDAEAFSIMLGCLLGEQWCAEFGWEWRLVTEDGVSRYGVLPADRRLAYFPMSDVYQLLTDAEDELNLTLLFNRQADGALGPAEAGQYLTVG
jgi:hypothetical protein